MIPINLALEECYSSFLWRMIVLYYDYLFRNFTKIRAQIEKDYGTAMVKLATTYLAKKPPPGVDYKSEDKADIK